MLNRTSISGMRRCTLKVGIVLLLVALSGMGLASHPRAQAEDLSSRAPSNVKPLFFSNADPWGSSWSYNIFSPSFICATACDLAIEPLAYQNPDGPDTFTPVLASSWALHNDTLTVNLRHDARWQDGKLITSKDVFNSVLLAGETFSPQWQEISSVSAPSRFQVVYKLAPGAPIGKAEDNILAGMFVDPPQQYSQFWSTPGLLKTIESYYEADRANPTAASHTAAFKFFNNLVKRLDDYNPKSFISDGPFKIDNVNTSEARLSKNPEFYDASDVKVQHAIWQETATGAAEEGEELSGEVDWTFSSWAGSTFSAILRVPHMHLVAVPDFMGYEIYFNSRHYPLNLLPVRKALAYVLHTPALLRTQDGLPNYDRYVKYSSLLYYSTERLYLTKQQLDSLDPYNYDPARAASLLKSAGFHERAGQWYEPNGKRFTLTAESPAGWPISAPFVDYVSNALNKFGIKTSGSTIDQPGYWTEQQKGNFDIEFGDAISTTDPLDNINSVLGPGMDPGGIGFGPVMNVPGLGKVNVPNTINREDSRVSYGPRMKQLVWDWVRLINQQLPVLQYGDKNIPFQYSTARYDWPSKNNKLWREMGSTSAPVSP